jgi:hypothetical protein
MDDDMIAVSRPGSKGVEFESLGSSLGKAVALWNRGRAVPMTIIADLMAQGYDVPSLERQHRR